MIIKTGQWRPVQGAFHVYAVYSGFRGLAFGPVQGQAISDVVGGPNFLSFLFYASLMVGGLTAMAGEIIQLVSAKRNDIEHHMDGLYIECAGVVLISLNFAALGVAVFISDNVPDARAVVYVFIFLGFLGRAFQSIKDVRTIRDGVRRVANGSAI